MLLSILAQAAAAALTPAEARAMTPAQLADALLEDGHPPIRAAMVHPVGMEAPSASLQAVTLTGVPGPAPERGWCWQVDWRVTLSPIDPAVNAYVTATPTRVSARETWERYRRASGRCDDPAAAFFTVWSDRKAAQFALIERLAAARALARGRRRLPFGLTCRDEDGARRSGPGGDRCGTDGGRTLLAALAIEQAINVLPARTSTMFRMSRIDRAALPPRTVQRNAEMATTDRGLIVDVEVSADFDGTITAIALKRHIPYPF